MITKSFGKAEVLKVNCGAKLSLFTLSELAFLIEEEKGIGRYGYPPVHTAIQKLKNKKGKKIKIQRSALKNQVHLYVSVYRCI